MDHAAIFLNIAALMAGTLSIACTAYMLRSKGYTFLKPLLGFLIFYNLVILIDLTTRYSCINLVETVYCDSIIMTRISSSLSSYFFILMTLMLAKMTEDFAGRESGRRLRMSTAIGLSIITLSYAARIVLAFTGPRVVMIVYFQISLLLLAYIVCMGIFVMMAFRRIGTDESKKDLMAPFGMFYLAAFTILLSVLIMHDRSLRLVPPVMFILLNVFPCLWYWRCFGRYVDLAIGARPGNKGLCDALRKFDVTKRELEIAGLIVSGKSNKEIVSTLFISMNTVKNHIYNLYRKTGVNSRSQLINMIIEECGYRRPAV